MKKIVVSEQVKELSDNLAINAFQKVEHYFPIDRFFLEEHGYLEKIKAVDYLEFIFYNFERIDNTYAVQLFLCLPELWENIEYESIKKLIENFTNAFSFFALVEFTYKYLRIDLLNEIFNSENVEMKFKRECADYFLKIIATFYLDEYDLTEFDNNLFGINIGDWDYIRQRLLVDIRFRPAMEIEELHERLTSIKNTFS